MCVFFLYQYYLNPIARLWRSHSQNPSTYLKSMFMLLLCIYVCKYIYLCVSVYTCFIVQNMYHCSLSLSLSRSLSLPVRLSIRAVDFEFYLYWFYWPSSNYSQLIFLEKGQIRKGMWNRSCHYLCLASLFTTMIDWRGWSLHWPSPRPEMKTLNVLLVLACFVCTRIMVVLQYRKPAATVWWNIKACGSL